MNPAILAAESVTAGTMAEGVKDTMSVVSTVLTTIKSEPILLAFLVAPIIGVAIGVVKRLRAR